MTGEVSMLQAMAGRFLTSRDVCAWEADSLYRCVALVRAFQAKALDPDGLRAAFASERTAPASATKAKGVAVLELVGPLTPNASIFSMLGWGTSLRAYITQLTAAAGDPTIRTILVVVDSPGGLIGLASEAAAVMRSVRGRKPIVVATVGLNASAAFWISSGASAITSTPSGQIGSIGIITSRESFAEQLKRDGVEVAVFSQPPQKAEGHPALPISDAERRWLQAQVDAAYTEFVNAIAIGRHTPASRIRDGYGQGRLVRADEALRQGMIDRVELLEQSLERAIAAPAELTAMLSQRIARQRRAVDDLHAERGRQEIAEYRRQAAARRAARR